MLTVNEYGGRQAKVNEKRQCFKGWETLVIISCDFYKRYEGMNQNQGCRNFFHAKLIPNSSMNKEINSEIVD